MRLNKVEAKLAAHLHVKEENCFMSNVCLLAIISAAYITMLLQGSSVGVWIGLRDEDTMKWTNGKSVSYTNWSPMEPKTYLTVS